MDSAQFLNRMKHFVKSSEKPSTSLSLKNELSHIKTPAFSSGADIKKFYESTIGNKAFDKALNISKSKPQQLTDKTHSTKLIRKAPFNINILMKSIENGDFKEAERFLVENEGSVNCQDQFGWTPLMSACCAGNESMVEFLLKWKPDLSLLDKRGRSCRHLAQAKGHQSVINVLKQYTKNLNKSATNQQQLPDESSKAQTPFYCNECKQNIEHTSYKKHMSSTVHNFSVASKCKMPTLYGIPESNKGFQILVKSGWNKEEGLGPSGEGHKFPPKTVLKQDRTGLGAKKYKAKVTHRPEDVRKEATPKNTLKRQLSSKKINEQRHERNLRRMLS